MSKKRSSFKTVTPELVSHLKKLAKKLKKNDDNLSQQQALDQVARNHGFANWKQVVSFSVATAISGTPTPNPSFKFISYDDVTLTENDKKNLIEERATDLQYLEKHLLVSNRAVLGSYGIEYSLFEPTITGLNKSILDATHSVRTHFELEEFHSYEKQQQGPSYKVVKNAFFVRPDKMVASKISLYRPKTKNGDPRMWFSGLGRFATPGSQVSIIILDEVVFLLNLTEVDLNQSIKTNDEIGKFIKRYIDNEQVIPNELLEKLREIAKKPLPALIDANNAVGLAIEDALGIPANSSKEPDYQGIEIKSGRGTKTRTTLFAQVPNWKLSRLKSSREILEAYGYERGNDYKLYCTLSAQKINSQGLSFKYCEEADELVEIHADGAEVAVWSGAKLRNRLSEKHSETFWIKADTEIIDGVEHFNLKSVIHTKAPLINQLMPLIESGVITMDHLIKRTGGVKPRVSEKGPLFKIDKRNLSLLFPAPVKYSLIEADNNGVE